jgi:enoyl-CoA hydratase
MDSSTNVRYEVAGPVARISIDRPERLNALNRATAVALDRAVADAIADPAVRVLVVTGAGDRAFVAGADIAEMASLTAAEAQSFSRLLQAAFDRIERSPKPVIAEINGFALGGGCELAMACHVRIAAAEARFGQPEVTLGLIPGAGGTQRLPRIVGRGRALDLLLSGDVIDAAEAHRIGLVNRVVAKDELRVAVDAYAVRLASRGPMALGRVIEAVVCGSEMAQDDAMRMEAALFGLSFATADMKEGTSAFLEKRKASFPGQ